MCGPHGGACNRDGCSDGLFGWQLKRTRRYENGAPSAVSFPTPLLLLATAICKCHVDTMWGDGPPPPPCFEVRWLREVRGAGGRRTRETERNMYKGLGEEGDDEARTKSGIGCEGQRQGRTGEGVDVEAGV